MFSYFLNPTSLKCVVDLIIYMRIVFHAAPWVYLIPTGGVNDASRIDEHASVEI